MDVRDFMKQYIKNPKTVGAIAPSSEKLAYKMSLSKRNLKNF